MMRGQRFQLILTVGIASLLALARSLLTACADPGPTTRVGVDNAGVEGNGDSDEFGDPILAISDDGRLVAFSSLATSLVTGDTNDVKDVFVHDRQ
ncbi:MAG: hypothetical protein AB1791_04750 [Chloroflexota bacterium]